MKTKILILTILISIFVLFIISHSEELNEYDNYLGYMKAIYKDIENTNFFVAEVKGQEVILKDSEFYEINRIPIITKEKSIKILSIHKEGEQIFFALGGAVDDSYGVMFSKTNYIDMNGLMTIERISGNAFYYSTSIR